MHFNARKAVQAAAVLLRCEGGRMEIIRLVKLLYIADRESLKETGRPICFAHPVAMEHGPVPSEVYDLIKGERYDEREWSRHIRREKNRLELTTEPDRGELSPYEIAKLTEVSEKFEDLSTWDIVEHITHNFDEWKNNRPAKGTSTRIPMSDLLRAVGREDDADDILKDLHDKAVFDEFFEGAAQ